jgi:hypothetical protein
MWPRRRNDKVRLFELTLLFDQNGCCRSWLAGLESLWPHAGAAFTTIKRSPNELDETCMLNVPGRGDDEIVVIELARVKTNGRFVIESRNGFPCAFDWPAERLIRKVSSVENLPEQLVGRVLDHFHLFEDDFLLAFEVFLFKTWVRNEVGE